MKKLFLIIHNVRSAYNVGAIFRTADGAGVEKIFLSGYTPRPFDERADVYPTKSQKMIAKTALGAETSVPWEAGENIFYIIEKLKKDKINIISLEQSESSVDIRHFNFSFPCALIVGNEVEGIEKEILEKSDGVVSIPMRGKKESLNVSVATGIAIYEILT